MVFRMGRLPHIELQVLGKAFDLALARRRCRKSLFGSGSADCLPVGVVEVAIGGVFRADGHGHASFDGGVGGSLHDVEHPWVVHGFEHQHDGCGQRVFDWRFAVFHVFEQRFNALPCFVGDSGTSIDDFGDGGWRGVRKFGDVR